MSDTSCTLRKNKDKNSDTVKKNFTKTETTKKKKKKKKSRQNVDVCKLVENYFGRQMGRLHTERENL